MGTSEPSARSYSATGSVVRAAICIGCGLGSLTLPVLAQAPAPTAEFQSKLLAPWQGDKPVEFRRPHPVAFDKGISDNSVLAKPGNEGVGQEPPWNAEEQVLVSLLLEEKRLLAYYGSEHPDVLSVRERIQVVREHLAQHRPAPPPSVPAALPPISVHTPYREVPPTTANTSRSPQQAPPVLLPPVRSQNQEPGGTEAGTAAEDRYGKTQTVTARSQPELIRPADFSAAGSPNRDLDTPPAGLPVPPPFVGEKKDKNTHPAAIASTNQSAQVVMSPPRSAGDKSVSHPSQVQPRGNSFFETGFGLLIGIVGAVLLGILIHLIALIFILRRYSVHLARNPRVELVNPAAVGFVGQESAAGAPTVAAVPAIQEVTRSSTAEAFDIGPTYAEAMHQKQEAERQQEEALLQHIFELNVQMREQLGQLSGGAA